MTTGTVVMFSDSSRMLVGLQYLETAAAAAAAAASHSFQAAAQATSRVRDVSDFTGQRLSQHKELLDNRPACGLCHVCM